MEVSFFCLKETTYGIAIVKILGPEYYFKNEDHWSDVISVSNLRFKENDLNHFRADHQVNWFHAYIGVRLITI